MDLLNIKKKEHTVSDTKLPLTRNTDNTVLNKDNAVGNGRVKINSLDWYVPHYSPNLEECNKLMTQIKKNHQTLLHYPERSVIMKEVKTQNLWTFELGTQEGINVPIWIFDRQLFNKLIDKPIKI